MRRKKYIIGNWKMNGLAQDLQQIGEINTFCGRNDSVDSAICPPVTLISGAAQVNTDITIGAQDVHHNEAGAHTGCLSAAMLKEAGARFSIVGHSERRADQGETDALVAAKAKALKTAGMNAILCVGETLETRDAGNAIDFVTAQLLASLPEEASSKWLTVAYEPVWAIGTGRVPQSADIADMHAALRAALTDRIGSDGDNMRILYGGSVNGGNASEILTLDNVDGALVGGASLTADKFLPILEAVA
ncbi:triose-phosphate isomerase [Sphingorhabdus sp. Alg239-R122]|uniref:triose-phosphate isomerase n=1 Tax=Sphingorhabdus sp. Alg239-R122 TaxID=2305989 RepID=UPI0013DD2266|nr:triose-phosphate isomerase [Sphingorhabdus sp. Alg239-R122]